jgi:TRAP-type transport system small permease protein
MRKAVYLINKFLEYTILALLVFVSILVFLQVVLRLFSYSLIWAEELSRFLFVWLIFLTTALAIYKKAHLRMDFVSERLQGKTQRFLELLTSLAVVFLFTVIGYYSIPVFTIWARKTSPIMGLPMKYVFLTLPVSSALILFNLVADILLNWKNPKTGGDQ